MAGARARLTDLVRKLLGGLGAAVATVALVLLGVMEPLELGSLSLLFEARGERKPTAPIVIVTIDEDSFDELNIPWPFPRAMHAKLLTQLSAGKPIAVGVDIIFPEPSARGPGDDEALGAAVAAAGNVVLGAARTVVAEAFYTKVDLNAPIPVIRRGAAAVAPVNLFTDSDGQVRRAPLRLRIGDDAMLAFDAQLHRLAAAAGVPAVPLPAVPEIMINFRGGPRTFPWVPYHRVVQGEIPPEAFQGKIVLIGPTSPVLQDIFSTPFARAREMPGVEIHANVLHTLLSGNRVREIPAAVSILAAVVSALLGAWLVVRFHALRALIAVVVLWVAFTAFAVVGFAVWDVWMRGMAGTLALLLGYGATVIENFVREQREKRRLSQFFSPDVLRTVVRRREDVSLGSSRRLLTVLFSDIRGFTSISERLEPEQVAEMLREYLSEMTEVVFKYGGTVDKYIGDCIMALYNVPFEDRDHAIKAIRTGLEFQERTLAVSARWEAKLGVSIRNGVGINTGEAIVGTLGSRQRLEYTAIGDTVNLASRLESITKDFGVPIIISEFTYEYLKGEFVTRQLGEVTVKGKTRPVKIYAVVPTDIRRYPRAALDQVATLTIVGSDQVCEVRTRDISEGGVALAGLPEDLPKGSKVRFRCEGGAFAAPLIAEGTLVWRRGDAAGVTFTTLEPESAPAVADYLASHEILERS